MTAGDPLSPVLFIIALHDLFNLMPRPPSSTGTDPEPGDRHSSGEEGLHDAPHNFLHRIRHHFGYIRHFAALS